MSEGFKGSNLKKYTRCSALGNAYKTQTTATASATAASAAITTTTTTK